MFSESPVTTTRRAYYGAGSSRHPERGQLTANIFNKQLRTADKGLILLHRGWPRGYNTSQ